MVSITIGYRSRMVARCSVLLNSKQVIKIMVSPEMTEMLMTLGEAGGITGMITAVMALLIRMIKKKGCTFRLNGCRGEPVVEVDCEEGAPTKRYLPKDSSVERTDSSNI